MTDFTADAEKYVRLVRARSTTQAEAVDLIAQALKTAHSGGVAEGYRQAAENGLRAFDRAAAALVGGPQTEAVEHFVKSGG